MWTDPPAGCHRAVERHLPAVDSAPRWRHEQCPAASLRQGSTGWYGRLGFEHAARHGIEIHLPDWAPPEAAQVVRLPSHDPDDSSLRGTVVYPAAFDGLGGARSRP